MWCLARQKKKRPGKSPETLYGPPRQPSRPSVNIDGRRRPCQATIPLQARKKRGARGNPRVPADRRGSPPDPMGSYATSPPKPKVNHIRTLLNRRIPDCTHPMPQQWHRYETLVTARHFIPTGQPSLSFVPCHGGSWAARRRSPLPPRHARLHPSRPHIAASSAPFSSRRGP